MFDLKTKQKKKQRKREKGRQLNVSKVKFELVFTNNRHIKTKKQKRNFQDELTERNEQTRTERLENPFFRKFYTTFLCFSV